jgi:DNA-binding NarL/FixJ family response regulator
MRVLVVDDHAIVRRGLRQILAEAKGIDAVSEANDAASAIAAVEKGSFDVVVLDVSLPDRSGIEVLAEIRARRPRLPVLILSVHPEDQLAVRALRAGASGYISKESAPEELVTALRRVTSGHRYVSPSLAEKLADGLHPEAAGPLHGRLSDREFAVFLNLAQGKRLKEIAGELGLSIKTVSTYRTRILGKLGFESNAQLTLYAAREGLIERGSS